MSSENFVLDSYALLAFLGSETGGEEVRQLIRKANIGECQLFMSVVNLGEVLYVLERRRALPLALEISERTNELPIEYIDAIRKHAVGAAHIKAHWPVSYADCFAAALAQEKGAAVVTGDSEFRQLEVASVVRILWLGGNEHQDETEG